MDTSNASVTLEAGTRVGSYLVRRHLARGGMGDVYEASHVILPREVALKVVHAEIARDPEVCQRMLQEACILESFAHPRVARVFECGVLPDRRPWIAMELLAGASLRERLEAGPRLASDELIAIMASIAEVLAAAHARGIVHRDVKPDNVIVGESLADLRVIDWGIAHVPALRAPLTLDAHTLGTPGYMAPEQVCGRAVDGKADVYALGVLAYEAAAGAPPLWAATPLALAVKHVTEPPPPLATLRPDLSIALRDLIDRMLAKAPALRPSAAEVVTALAAMAAAGGSPGGAGPDTAIEASATSAGAADATAEDDPAAASAGDDRAIAPGDDDEPEVTIEPLPAGALLEPTIADGSSAMPAAAGGALDQVLRELDAECDEDVVLLERPRLPAPRWTPTVIVAPEAYQPAPSPRRAA